MNDQSWPQPASPTAADHVALRALIKYMSRVLGITYKATAREAGSNESAVKNYANDKSTMAAHAADTYTQLYVPCARLVADKLRTAAPEPFLLGALTHLFKDDWVHAQGIRPPAVPLAEPLDRAVERWTGVLPRATEEVEARFCGLWRVVRASSRPTPAEQEARFELTEINCSLLNIRPRSVDGGALCGFKLYYLGRGRRNEERLTFEGFVLPKEDRLEFLGRATNRRDLLSLMVWRFTSNPDISEHSKVSSGVSLALNTSGGPVAARVVAFFADGSDRLPESEFDAMKDKELLNIGVRAIEASGEIVPADQFEETVRYLNQYKPIVGFFAN